MKKLVFFGLSLGMTSSLAATPANTYVWLVRNEVKITDPTQAYDESVWFNENIYETLVTYQSKNGQNLAPLLANSMPVISKNGLSYTFNLRKGVKFHSGNILSCDDVLYTYRRALVVGNDESWVWIIRESLLNVSSVEDIKKTSWKKIENAIQCVAPDKVIFNLTKPDATFLAKLAFYSAGIIDSKHAIKLGEWSGTENGWQNWIGQDLNNSPLSKNPSGTGAYQLFQEGIGYTAFKAFSNYWGLKPKIENVIIKFVIEESTRIAALVNDDADQIEVSRSGLEKIQSDKVKILKNYTSNNSFALLMNQNINPDSSVLGSGKLDGQGIPVNFFSDINIRKAFAYSFGQEQFIKEIWQGNGSIRTMITPDTFPLYNKNLPIYQFNREKATEYFKKAWNGQVWEKGFVIQAYYTEDFAVSQAALELLKRNIEAINPKFKINVQSRTYYDILIDSNQGKSALMDAGWQPDYADPDNLFHTFYHSEGYYGKWYNYNNKMIDQLIEKAKIISNLAERAKIYNQITQIAYDNATLIILPTSTFHIVTRKNVQGYEENYNSVGAGLIYWKYLSK